MIKNAKFNLMTLEAHFQTIRIIKEGWQIEFCMNLLFLTAKKVTRTSKAFFIFIYSPTHPNLLQQSFPLIRELLSLFFKFNVFVK